MKKALLILMMVLLPWQAATAAQHQLVHLLSDGGVGAAALALHVAEHEAHIPHHHDDDGDDDGDDDDHRTAPHHDNSASSLQHLSDFDHAGSLHLLWYTPQVLSVPAPSALAPALSCDGFASRHTHPLLRPPCQPA